MTVRFSDIIRVKEKRSRSDGAVESGREEERLWLSDSQILKVQDERETFQVPGEEVSQEIAAYYQKFIDKAVEARDRVMKDLGISPSPILSDLHYVIDKNLSDRMYEYALSVPNVQDEMPVHAVDVTCASLKVGRGMGYDTKRLLQLGLAAFLENVGMYKIPDHVLKKQGRLEEHELLIIKNHPKVSAQILSRLGERYQWLAEVALQIHERMDGSGYPRGLKGTEISELASIIGLIDTYVALIKNRPYRDKLIQTDAVKFIIKEAKGLFPAKILKVFLTQISLFPVNTYVRLNNKCLGRVISTDKAQPLRPAIELLYDGLGNRLDKREVVRLADNPLLYIVKTVNEAELPQVALDR
jgi:HD-GYP domain-containing protein (c-di-GMP phosphodiesterase class II)